MYSGALISLTALLLNSQPYICFRGRPRGLFYGWLPNVSDLIAIYSLCFKSDSPRLFLTLRYAWIRALNLLISLFICPSKYTGSNVGPYSTK
jgi:hypothetical protein